MFQCVSCSESHLRVYRDELCVCQDGYFDDNSKTPTCKECDAMCKTCVNQPSQCTSCMSELRFTHMCICREGYREEGDGQCVPCPWICSRCTEFECTECRGNRINLPGCECPYGQIEKGEQKCTICANQCETCVGEIDNCVKCRVPRFNPPRCECGEGKYDDPVTKECEKCHISCKTCDQLGCLSCNGNRDFFPDTRACNCPPGAISFSHTPFCANCDFQILQVQLSPDLKTLTCSLQKVVKFYQKAVRTPNEVCSYVLKPKSLGLVGVGAECLLLDNSIIVTLGTNPKFTSETEIEFHSRVLIGDKCTQPITVIVPGRIVNPPVLNNPTASLKVPTSYASLCDEIVISLDDIQFTGNRQLFDIYWRVKEANPPSATVISSLSSLFSVANSQQNTSVMIPQMTLSEFGQYSIIVHFKNYLYMQGKAEGTFRTLSFEAPEISFKLDQGIQFYTWQPIIIQAIIRHFKCDNGFLEEVFDAMNLNWTEVASERNPPDNPAMIPAYFSRETDGLEFLDVLSFLPYNASINTMYMLKLEVRLTNKPVVLSE